MNSLLFLKVSKAQDEPKMKGGSVLCILWDCLPPSTVEAIGVHGMLITPKYGIIAIPGDSVLYIPDAGRSSKIGVSIETPFRHRMSKPVQYMESICAVKPKLGSTLYTVDL